MLLQNTCDDFAGRMLKVQKDDAFVRRGRRRIAIVVDVPVYGQSILQNFRVLSQYGVHLQKRFRTRKFAVHANEKIEPLAVDTEERRDFIDRADPHLFLCPLPDGGLAQRPWQIFVPLHDYR